MKLKKKYRLLKTTCLIEEVKTFCKMGDVQGVQGDRHGAYYANIDDE